MRPLQIAAFYVGMALPGVTHACLWDSDTLAAESSRFPEVQGIMTGVFPRHSKEYHAWRVQQKLPLMDSGKATASDFDDLAVSLHKLGSHKGAIDVMMSKEKKLPGLYETYSNLGTFYIYTGELRTAKKWIEKALAINSNAHFGREKYQRWLVMWLLEKSRGAPMPADPDKAREARREGLPDGFAAFVARQEQGEFYGKTTQRLTLNDDQRKAAIHGVTGMMYFADFDNPVLLEALGDLLGFGGMQENASHLAGLCYLQAAGKVADPLEKDRLYLLSNRSLSGSHTSQEKMVQTLQKALDKGGKLAKAVQNDELGWIASGKDATAEFQKKYLKR